MRIEKKLVSARNATAGGFGLADPMESHGLKISGESKKVF